MMIQIVSFHQDYKEAELTNYCNLVSFTALLFWCMLEVTLGIIACCLPTLRPLLQHKFIAWILQSIQSKISYRSRKAAVSNYNAPHKSLTHQGPKVSQETPLVPGSQYEWIGLAEESRQDNSELTAIRVETSYTIQSEIIA
jgi:hypothetical protein